MPLSITGSLIKTTRSQLACPLSSFTSRHFDAFRTHAPRSPWTRLRNHRYLAAILTSTARHTKNSQATALRRSTRHSPRTGKTLTATLLWKQLSRLRIYLSPRSSAPGTVALNHLSRARRCALAKSGSATTMSQAHPTRLEAFSAAAHSTSN